MKVAVVSQFFPPEPCAAANRIEALAAALVRAGHDVTVVTAFPSFPSGRLQKSDRFKLVRRESRNGARIVRLLTMRFQGLPASRFLHWTFTACAFLTFMLTTRMKFDAVIVTVPPITLALPAIMGSLRHRAKLVVDVRDVYPDVAIAMGEWREGSLLARAAEFVVRALYRRAALISTVTPTTLRQIASRNVDLSRLLLAPNGADEPPQTVENSAIEATFTAVYAGNLGLATDVDILVNAAELLAADKSISIGIIGDGAQAQRMKERIRAANLSNISLIGALPRDKTLRMLTQAKVALVPLRKGISDSIPTKIFDAFSVGCPVVVCGDGEARAIALNSQGGDVVPAGDAPALAEAIARFALLDDGARSAYGGRGRAFVRQYYSRGAIMDKLCARI